MVLWTKLWYYRKKTIELLFTKEKNMVNYQKIRNFIYNGKNYGNIPKQLKFLNKCIALEL